MPVPMHKSNKAKPPDFDTRYRKVLRVYLRNKGEAQLMEAYDIGRDMLAAGMGVIDIVQTHQRALRRAVSDTAMAQTPAQIIENTEPLLMESLLPFEMVHRGQSEANAALRRANAALEEEARRIGQMLHDEAGQMLATVYLDLAETARNLPASRLHHVDCIRGHLDKMRDQLRRISHELRPPVLDDLGLLPALRFLGDGIAQRSGLTVAVRGKTGGRLNRSCEVVLYRIVQEALTNTIRHAQASRVDIELTRRPGVVHCVICDDGIGFDVAAIMARRGNRGLGLVGMRERLTAVSGDIDIRSRRGSGAELHVTIPHP